MRVLKAVLLAALAMSAAAVWAQSARPDPNIGYLFPAGGQRGKVIQITAGGQFLRGATGVFVSGDGVHARVIKHYPPLRNLDPEQRQELQKRMLELRTKRLAEMSPNNPIPSPLLERFGRQGAGAQNPNRPQASDAKPTTQPSNPNNAKLEQAKTKPLELPDHPLLQNWENMSLRELDGVQRELFSLRNRQQNAQIAEMVLIEITIDPDATPGDRELRLETPAGLTNPLCFQVGLLPEIREREMNDPIPTSTLPPDTPIDLPVVINGQIKLEDVDRFRIKVHRGQHLVIEAQARHLIPYLADAVPGWFQPTLALYDSKGKEVAFVDHYLFNQDPVMFYEIKEDGVYELEVRDSIYRGREDFVYRISAGELPFITQIFPLGGKMGKPVEASIKGWNLETTRLSLDTKPGNDHIRQTALQENQWLSNTVPYAVDTLPECLEAEPNDSIRGAQRINWPIIVNGHISRSGDTDVYRIQGKAGDELVIEIWARRLNSPLDSLLKLTDETGRVLELNDDHEDKEMGLLTHHADSYIRTKLPKTGPYYIHLTDSQNHGGEAYAYRLRIAAPDPDFSLCMDPSSLNVPFGRTIAFTVYAFRKDGFDGDIEVGLKDIYGDFRLSGGRIPAGHDHIRMTMTYYGAPIDRPITLQLEGRARVRGKTIIRPVAPAEDMMQAFAYRHLVPSQKLMVTMKGFRGRFPPIELASGLVSIPAGGTTEVRFKAQRALDFLNIDLELKDPPEGVTLQQKRMTPEGMVLVIKADGIKAKAGVSDNLIIEAFTEVAAGAQQNNKAPTQKRRVSMGFLPAIPFQIVGR